MKKTMLLKTISLALALSSATTVHPMAPDSGDQQSFKRHADDDGKRPEKRQRAAAYDEEVMKCVICQEALEGSEATTELSCHHRFHQECIDAWFQRVPDNPTCPYCRAVQSVSALAVQEDIPAAQAVFVEVVTLLPLHEAIVVGDNQRAIQLITDGADVNAICLGVTPLQIAVTRENTLLVESLLANGANPNLFDEHAIATWTPLEIAIEKRNLFLVQQLLAHRADPNLRALWFIDSMLHDAIGNFEIAQALISAGANVNARGRQGATPLHFAAIEGAKSVINLLLERGANINAEDIAKRTPLHWVTNRPHISKEMIEVLAAKGININHQDCAGQTAFFWAVKERNTQAIEPLILAGANINIKDLKGNSPLSIAIQETYLEGVQALIRAGACIEEEDIQEARRIVREYSWVSPRIKAFMREFITRYSSDTSRSSAPAAASNPAALAAAAGASLVREFHFAPQESGDGSLQLVFASEAILPRQVNQTQAPAPTTSARRVTRQSLMELRIAIIDKKPSSIALLRGLIAGGIDINIRGRHGETLLHLAAHHENIEVVGFLLDQPGIDLHARDGQNNTIIEATRSEEIRAIIQEAIERQQP